MRRSFSAPSVLAAVALLAAAAAWAITYPDPDLDVFDPPCTLTVSVDDGAQRVLSWSAVSGASTYRVGFRRCDGSTAVLADVTGTSYTHSGYHQNECLEYLLVAYDSGGSKVCAAHVVGVGGCPCP